MVKWLLTVSHWQLAIIGGLCAAIGIAVAQVAIPRTAGRIVDDVLLRADAEALPAAVKILAVAGASATIFTLAHSLTFQWLSAVGLAGSRERAWRCIEQLEARELDQIHTGQLVTLLNDDLALLTRLYHPILADVTLGGAQAAVVLSFAASQYGWLAGALLLVPLYVACPLLFSRQLRRATRIVADAKSAWNAGLLEMVRGIREIRLLARTDWADRNVASTAATLRRGQVRLHFVTARVSIKYAASFAVLCLLYYLGGRRVLNSQMPLGELVTLVGLIALMEGPSTRLLGVAEQLPGVMAAADRVAAVLRRRMEPRQHTVSVSARRIESIEFRHVSFAYDTDAGLYAVAGVSFRIERGERVAIVGSNGSGKTTLIRLLTGCYQPTGGLILVNGRDIQDWNLCELRESISVVQQNPIMFADTIANNIAVGRRDATGDDVHRAAQVARVSEYASQLRNGLTTHIGEGGVSLSSGQRQRLAIARAVVRNADLLILDEGTNGVDRVADDGIMSTLNQVMANGTIIAISHYPDANRRMDRIIVMSEGRTVADGSPDELERSCRVYGELMLG
jgi:ABC-type multidrug transport system fused ATPase/permease subunit